MKEDVEHRCKIGVELSEGLVLLLLLFRIIHLIPIGQLSRKGGDLIVPKATSEDLGPDRLGKFGKERDRPESLQAWQLRSCSRTTVRNIAEYRGR